jgi:hypothetical protein
MKTSVLLFLCFGIFMVFANLALADCADIGGFSSFSVSPSSNTVTLYSGNRPFAKIDIRCDIQPTSSLQLIKSYVCGGDEVLVDGNRCTILSVTSSLD